MPIFQYRALQPDGAITEGTLNAGGRPEALRQIETLGLRPLKLSEGRSKTGKITVPGTGQGTTPLPEPISGRVSSKELETFTRLLSSLVAAGVP